MVTILNAWIIEGDYPTNGLSLAASAGSNRVGVLVLTGEIQNDAGGAVGIASVTWGGQSCTEVFQANCGDILSYNNCVGMWYLTETQIAAMSGSAITVTWENFDGNGTFGTGGIGPFGNGKVAAAFYQDVDQANINSASNNNSTGATSATATTITMGVIDTDVDEQVIVGTISGQGTTADDFNAPTGWTQEVEVLGATNDHNIAVFTRDAQTNDDALNTTFTCDSANRLAIGSISLGSAAPVVDAEIAASISLRPSTDADKTVAMTVDNKLALRASTDNEKAISAVVTDSMAVRSANDAAKTAAGGSVFRLGLRSLVATLRGPFEAAVRALLALRPSSAADKTVGQIAAARLALRPTADADKAASGTVVARLALSSRTAYGKVAAGIASAGLAIRSSISAVGGAVVSAVNTVRLGLRSISAADKTAAGTARSRLALRAGLVAAKVSNGIAAASLALRTAIAFSTDTAFNAVSRVSLSLRTSVAVSFIKLASARARFALRLSTDGTKLSSGTALHRIAISSTSDGHKTSAGVAFNRVAIRTTTQSGDVGVPGTTVRRVPLDGVFDLTCRLDGIFDTTVPLTGHINPVP